VAQIGVKSLAFSELNPIALTDEWNSFEIGEIFLEWDEDEHKYLLSLITHIYLSRTFDFDMHERCYARGRDCLCNINKQHLQLKQMEIFLFWKTSVHLLISFNL
jgi:hypothetical protein